ncbi:ferredoxin--NADP reductase [Patescibacteria group bacterium]
MTNKPKLQNGVLTLKTKRDLTDQVWEFIFDADQALEFTPGQFFMVEIPHEGKTVKRAYSAACLPGKKTLKLLVKYMPTGIASGYFDKMQVGDTLEFSGPYGALTLADDYAGPIIFAVTGTGLSPVWSILENLKAQGRKNPVHLLMGVTTAADALYLDEFDKMVLDYPFTYTVCVEKPEEGYEGARGFVTEHISSPPIPFDPKDAKVFVVGNPVMVQAMLDILKEKGWLAGQIYVEKFG